MKSKSSIFARGEFTAWLSRICRNSKSYHRPFGLSCLVFLVFSTGLYAQQGFVATGGDASNGTGSINYSVGQVGYLPTSNATGDSYEGIQQPYELFPVGMDEPNAYPEIVAYPNPADGKIFLELGEMPLIGTAYQLTDINGKQISKGEMDNQRTTIDLSHLSKATYFLHVTLDGNPIKSFKILKSEKQ